MKLSQIQFEVLFSITHGPADTVEISQRIGKPETTVCRTCHSLERHGFVSGFSEIYQATHEGRRALGIV